MQHPRPSLRPILSAITLGVLTSAGLTPVANTAEPPLPATQTPSAPREAETPAPKEPNVFRQSNLAAWCIVPFDKAKRTPEQRAEMLEKLKLRKFVYDYRQEHIPQWEEEMEALKRHHIQLLGWWFPGTLVPEAFTALDLFRKYNLKPQLWISGGGGSLKAESAQEQARRVDGEVRRIKTIAEHVKADGLTIGLYNHGSWFGEPENQIEIIKALRAEGITNVGMVYNQHHGHGHIDNFKETLQRMLPYLICLNLNGMDRNGDAQGRKILPLGTGTEDLKLLKIIKESGYKGPIGILNHTGEDAEGRLLDNLDGLRWLTAQFDGKTPGPQPVPRTYNPVAAVAVQSATKPQEPPNAAASLNPAFGKALQGKFKAEGKDSYRTLPLTVECRVKLNSAKQFNILVASDPKASADHWELYTFVGSGFLSLYLPGHGVEMKSEVNVCDGAWHAVSATIGTDKARLFVDGKLVKEGPVSARTGTPMPGGLAIGSLAEGTLGCDGLIDNVRLSSGIRQIGIPTETPLLTDASTLALWNFDELPATPPAPAPQKAPPVTPPAAPLAVGSVTANPAPPAPATPPAPAPQKAPPVTPPAAPLAAGSVTANPAPPAPATPPAPAPQKAPPVTPPAAPLAAGSVTANPAPPAPATPTAPAPQKAPPVSPPAAPLAAGSVTANPAPASPAAPPKVLPVASASTPAPGAPQTPIPADPPKTAYRAPEPVDHNLLPPSFILPAATPERLTKANGWPPDGNSKDWGRSLGGPTSNRFSTLSQINRNNVHQLKPAWTFHSGDGAANIQCNPIVVKGTVYTPTPGKNIVAINAATGVEKWRFSPSTLIGKDSTAPARRGLLYWNGDAQNKPRLLFGDGNWFLALDPETGKPIENFGSGGKAPIPSGTTVVGAMYGHICIVPGYAGDVYGIDARDGRCVWTFKTRPPAGEYGNETWSQIESGANCWGGMAMDESRGIAYVSVGSPKPNFFGFNHQGDNLFSNCVLALDARTGKRLWHFQELRHDIWDWDIPAPPNLVTVLRHGKRVDALAQVTKLGNTLLLDRVTGEPLYDFRFVRVDTHALPGDHSAVYQPAPETPPPFARQAYLRKDLPTDPDARAGVLPLFERSNFGYFPSFDEARPTLMFNIHGGAEWTGAAADAKGFLYVTSNEIPWTITCFRDDDPAPLVPANAGEQVYQLNCAVCHGPDRKGIAQAPPLRGVRHRLSENDIRALLKTGRASMPPMAHLSEEQLKPLLDFVLCKDRPQNSSAKTGGKEWTFSGFNRVVDANGYPACSAPWGTLNCIDLNTGKMAWRVPLGEYAELTAKGIPQTGQENFGGAMVTSTGLVFASGTRDKKIRAFDAATGAELWSHELPLHGTAPPTCYEADGRQFILLPATGGGKLTGPTGDTWVAFALPK